MNEANRENRIELGINQPPVPPAVESFSDLTHLSTSWLRDVAHDTEFLHQIETRKKFNDHLNTVLSRLPTPDVSLEEALAGQHLTEQQVVDLYVSLSDLLKNNPEDARIVFYLPFEFLPQADWKPESQALQQAIDQFQTAYKTVWNRLLSVHDVRANFVDGDVMEVKLRDGDLPRVVKAAHLIPKLVEKGLMNTEEVFTLMETTKDEVLKHSIADTLPVLADLGFIKEPDLDRVRTSRDVFVRTKAAFMTPSAVKRDTQERQTKDITLALVERQLRLSFQKIDEEVYKGITKKREEWLKKEKKRTLIESLGGYISAAVIRGSFSPEIALSFVTQDALPASQQTLIEGVRKAIESVAQTDHQKANELYATYHEVLLSLWNHRSPQTQESLSKTFCRLRGLSLVDDRELTALGITLPKLAGPFSENLKTMEKELQEIRTIADSIEKNPELSPFVYPVILVFGSRLKGYGAQTADMDIAVFVKPGTSLDDAKKIQALTKDVCIHEKIEGEIVQFWLEKTKDGLAVRDDVETVDPSMGEKSWTHVLFGAAWEGNPHVIEELRRQLLVPYLTQDQPQERKMYLEELERDTLQYRLMHKGYEKFFPAFGGLHTPHADHVDGQSTFWDSGYRQMATKLFASRVFLPKISQP